MECKVLRENATLEVAVTITLPSNENYKTLVSDSLNLQDSLIFQAKHMAFMLRISNNSGYQNTFRYQNIVLIRVQKSDKNDKSVYQIKMSCPEFDVKENIFYSDDSHWRVLNENQHSTSYTFKLTIQVESHVRISYSVLYDDEQLTDFQLKAPDGAVSIHKAFLAATSAVFRSKLINDLKENVTSLEIPDTTVKALEDFKKCIYLNTLPTENLEELLLLASYFKINWLEHKCVDKMLTTMSTGEAVNVFEFVLKHRHMPLFLGIMDQVQCGNLKMGLIRKHYLQQ